MTVAINVPHLSKAVNFRLAFRLLSQIFIVCSCFSFDLYLTPVLIRNINEIP